MSEQTPTFTRRQLQLLQLIEAGRGNRDIAEQLQISEHTVKVHLWRLFKRLGVGSRTMALAAWKATQPDELAALRAQRDVMFAALIVAREFISTDRNAFADAAMPPDGGLIDPSDAAELADFDAALLQINAAMGGMSERKGFYLGVKVCGCITASLVDDENTTAKEVAEFAKQMQKTGRKIKHAEITEKELQEIFKKCECPPVKKAAIEKAGEA